MRACFPKAGLAWELNYRGDLVFLRQARAAAARQKLTVEDGWVYFLHGWTRVIADVFDVDIPTSGPGVRASFGARRRAAAPGARVVSRILITPRSLTSAPGEVSGWRNTCSTRLPPPTKKGHRRMTQPKLTVVRNDPGLHVLERVQGMLALSENPSGRSRRS